MTTLSLNRSARRTSLAALLLAASLVTGMTACAPQEQGATVGSAADGEASTQTLDAAAFAELVTTNGVVVVDVRTPQEYAEGHLDGALNLDVSSPDFAAAIAALDPDVTYALYCRSGNRSAQAMDVMSSAGLTSLAHLDGGVAAWTSDGGTLVAGS